MDKLQGPDEKPSRYARIERGLSVVLLIALVIWICAACTY